MTRKRLFAIFFWSSKKMWTLISLATKEFCDSFNESLKPHKLCEIKDAIVHAIKRKKVLMLIFFWAFKNRGSVHTFALLNPTKKKKFYAYCLYLWFHSSPTIFMYLKENDRLAEFCVKVYNKLQTHFQELRTNVMLQSMKWAIYIPWQFPLSVYVWMCCSSIIAVDNTQVLVKCQRYVSIVVTMCEVMFTFTAQTSTNICM